MMISDSFEDKENQYQTKHQLIDTKHNTFSQTPTTDVMGIVREDGQYGNAESTENNEVIEIDDDDEDDDDDDDVAEESDHIEDGIQKHVPIQQLHKNGFPAANEFDEMSKRFMKPVIDYPVSDQTYNIWEILDWSGLSNQKVRGPLFECGGYEWNILLFPRGNNNNNNISIYIEPRPKNNDDDDWYVCAQFGFDLWNPDSPNSHIPSFSYHRFNKNDSDWGFTSFVDLAQLMHSQDGLAPILANNKLNITAYIKIIDDSSTGVLWYNFAGYDSKKNTGYVGLNNQGATCYLNSLLQSYFTTKVFRKLVYQIPTTSNTIIKSNKKIKKQSDVALSLQKIFYLLSNSQVPVGTLELTKSFGWDTNDAFTQHDIQELNRILMDKLETSMKGTAIENRLNDLFVGKMKSFIKCINVPYESSRVEDYWDIQLNVKGFQNLQESFANYIEIEMLTDDNKYQAGDEYGYQDAKKGVVFQLFPPVLHLQLKRFEYDFMIDDLSKINDLYEFPDLIDLSPYLDEDLPLEEKQKNWTYKLHGVLVHQGSISNGHYYAMIKPSSSSNQWYRFEDDKVWKVTRSQVFQDNFGANEISDVQYSKLSRIEQGEYVLNRSTSAYMLVYYRETNLQDILPDNDDEIDNEIPKFIPKDIEHQLNESQMLESLKQQQLHNIEVKFITLGMFQHYHEFGLFHDSVNTKFYDEKLITAENKPISMSFKKTDSIFELYNKINESKNLNPVASKEEVTALPYRLLVLCHRNNLTNRVNSILNVDENLDLSAVYTKYFNQRYDDMVFYIDEGTPKISEDPDTTEIKDFDFAKVLANFKHDQAGELIPLDEKNIIVFIKVFDPTVGLVHGLTHLVVLREEPVETLIPQVQHLLGISHDLEIFEELNPQKLEVVFPDSNFDENEIGNGDILIFQFKDVPAKFSSVIDYYKFLASRLHVNVSPWKESDYGEESDNGDDDVVVINSDGEDVDNVLDFWISTNYTYEDLSKEIGSRIGSDPQYLRLFIINQHGLKYPMKTSSNLSQYVPKSLPISTTIRFEYEILKISLKEFENMKTFKVTWCGKIFQCKEFEIMVNVDEGIDKLVEKLLKLLEENKIKVNSKDLVMWYGNNNKCVGIVKFNESIDNLNESFDYYVNELPIEATVLKVNDLVASMEPLEDLKFDNEIDNYEYEMAMKYLRSFNIIPVFHFHKSSTNHHSVPFLFIVFPLEKFKDTKRRLQNKLGLNDANFSKIKFALADIHDKGKYLVDTDEMVLYDQISDTGLSLALDHIDRNPKKLLDKGIQIK